MSTTRVRDWFTAACYLIAATLGWLLITNVAGTAILEQRADTLAVEAWEWGQFLAALAGVAGALAPARVLTVMRSVEASAAWTLAGLWAVYLVSVWVAKSPSGRPWLTIAFCAFCVVALAGRGTACLIDRSRIVYREALDQEVTNRLGNP